MSRSLLISIALAFIACIAFAVDPEADFKAGNQAYEQGHFEEAAQRYRAAITNGGSTASSWFNLGDACFKSGELGRAIAAWRVAERFDPRDAALRANVQFARKRAQAGAEAGASLLRTAIRYFTVSEWMWSATAGVASVFLLLAGCELRRTRTPRAWLCGLIGIAAISTYCAFLSYKDAFLTRHGVVIAKEAVLRLGPLDESKLAFKLTDGAEAEVTDTTPGWVQLRTSNGRIGWARQEDIVFVSPGTL